MSKVHIHHIFLVLIACYMLTPAVHGDEKKTILVLDASGSMWGQIEGKTKIAIAREAIAEVLKGWDANNELGLIAYGHRTKGDCNDIETLIPVGKLNRAAFNEAIGKLNPKGKTPLTAAVLQAAEQLKYTADKATVILVSDGRETCGADPCAAAKQMAKDGVDFKVHVIGFNVLEKSGIAQLRCLAENTGGEYLTAKNAVGLKKALGQAVKRVTTGPIGHKFYVSLKEGGAPLTAISDYWYIYGSEADIQGNRKLVVQKGDAQPLFTGLKKGRYLVVVQHGYARSQTEFDVKGSQDSIVHHLSLNAGFARLKVALTEGGKPLNSISDYWYVYGSAVDEQGNRSKVATVGQAHPTLVLPQGRYHVVVNHGYGRAEGDIVVKAGEASDLSLVLNEGFARLKVALTEGGKPLNSISDYWYVYGSAVDEQGNRSKVATVGQAHPTLVLPQGRYHVVVNHNQRSAQGDFNVVAGSSIDLMLILPSAREK